MTCRLVGCRSKLAFIFQSKTSITTLPGLSIRQNVVVGLISVSHQKCWHCHCYFDTVVEVELDNIVDNGNRKVLCLPCDTATKLLDRWNPVEQLQRHHSRMGKDSTKRNTQMEHQKRSIKKRITKRGSLHDQWLLSGLNLGHSSSLTESSVLEKRLSINIVLLLRHF